MHGRKFDSSWKALLHFDFPYYAEPDDGLRDEIGKLNGWHDEGTRVGWVGSDIPNDNDVLANYVTDLTPKFGYRCPYFPGDGSYSIKVSDYDGVGLLPITNTTEAEIEFFVRPETSRTSSGGAIIKINSFNDTSNHLTLSATPEGFVTFSSSIVRGGDIESANPVLTSHVWHHVMIRILSGVLTVWVDGVQVIGREMMSNAILEWLELTLGEGFTCCIDELLIKYSASSGAPVIPTEPYQGYVDPKDFGGFGDGRQGELALTSGTTYYINSVGQISTITDTTHLTIGSWTTGMHGVPVAGDEIMIIQFSKSSVSKGSDWGTGYYEFFKIKSISGKDIELDHAPIEFSLTSSNLTTYDMWVYTVPNYTRVTIGAEATIRPRMGIVVFRCKKSCTIDGKILTVGVTPMLSRYDYQQMTHQQLPTRFIVATGGGGVMMFVGGTLTISENARIGASYSGNPTRSTDVWNIAGGAGYGGMCEGRLGGVGGGAASGADVGKLDSGWPNGVKGTGGCGGYPGSWQTAPFESIGTQGITRGAMANAGTVHQHGAGALGYCPNISGGANGATGDRYGGANVMILCRTLSASKAAISTGGESINTVKRGSGGWNGSAVGGAAGSGMCYIACSKYSPA